ncbi:MotA/TolQ/ExbB proton channel family protein [Gloeothece verrucosa]|uniref:MotA/TolQ/ExbB proton channel domain-containing protein n=1 Tax=Gloeothece verrucosa (strain PCC 7822) TaxID=497965 RepID=E0UDB3_GLOV7|nr:MotA/TolQ/ExbB proton channel family protein [Gloeothece verrucosa]ADN14104.1 hypothetical protein Cyan7822_2124 [Gloeothece verrucosa PCC 7822]
MKQKRGANFSPTSGDSERKRLEVSFGLILTLALALSIIIYVAVLPFRASYLGILLYDRGWTQPLAIWFACIVATLTLIKLIKINREFRSLKRIWISDVINFNNPQSLEVLTFQKNLARENSLVGLRCSRVIAAYSQSNSRKTASEFALDDASFYVSSSESSYAFPRILIWAIPLLGFIGTVVGISQAVNGFNGFLEKSSDIGQIKQGIGTVTSGLAVAFDTTLLALLLSVLVMIPMVLVERYESRLLLAIDIFINDELLPRFKEESNSLEQKNLKEAVNQAIQESFPRAQDLIEPAHEYAKQAVTDLRLILGNELTEIQKNNQSFITQLNEINQLSLQDRQGFTTFLERQQQAYQDLTGQINRLFEGLKINYTDSLENQQQVNQDLINQVNGLVEKLTSNYRNSLENQQQVNQDLLTKINNLVEQLKVNYTGSLENQQQVNQGLLTQINHLVEQLKVNYTGSLENQQQVNQSLLTQINHLAESLKSNYTQLSGALTTQSHQMTEQLKQAANLLETRIQSLENAAYKLSDITQLKTSLDHLIKSLEKVEPVEQVIKEAMSQIKELKPSLEKLSKPRIITFAESDE